MMEEQSELLMKKDFDVESFGGDNSAKIKRVIDELTSATVSPGNAEKYHSKVDNHDTVIESQIENNYVSYKENKKEYVAMMSESRTKEMRDERRLVPLDVHEMLYKMVRELKQIVSWQMVQKTMFDLYAKKLFAALQDANAHEIKRDALKEMREMETKRNELFLEVMKGQNAAIKETVSAFVDKMRLERQEDRLHYVDSMGLIAETMRETVKLVCDSQGFDENTDFVNKKIKQFQEEARTFHAERERKSKEREEARAAAVVVDEPPPIEEGEDEDELPEPPKPTKSEGLEKLKQQLKKKKEAQKEDFGGDDL